MFINFFTYLKEAIYTFQIFIFISREEENLILSKFYLKKICEAYEVKKQENKW